MKAVVCPKYGPPEVLQIRKFDKPSPKENEIRVKIFATAVTASDCIVRGFKLPRWHPMGIMMGLVIGFRAPRNPILGMVLAGEVDAIGAGVTRFKQGDQVFGSTLKPNNNLTMRFGTYAQYMCLPENSLINFKPAHITYEEAAAIPYGAGLAHYFLKKAAIQPGQKVLIYGASGAIGTAAVQLAKHDGAVVTGVCSSDNFDLVRSLGADQLLDYRKENAPPNGDLYDFVFDAVGEAKSSNFKEACKLSLKPDGQYLTVDSGNPQNTLDELDFFNELIEANELRAVIDSCFPLDQIVEAHRRVDTGHKKGNVVITVTHQN